MTGHLLSFQPPIGSEPFGDCPIAVQVGYATPGEPLTLPVSWHAARRGQDLPLLDGFLELRRLDQDAAHLSLLGSYRSGLSVTGGTTGRLRDHLLVEAYARHLVLGIAERIAAALPEPVAVGRDPST